MSQRKPKECEPRGRKGAAVASEKQLRSVTVEIRKIWRQKLRGKCSGIEKSRDQGPGAESSQKQVRRPVWLSCSHGGWKDCRARPKIQAVNVALTLSVMGSHEIALQREMTSPELHF